MIETERLLLRPARMDDLTDMHCVFSHPDAMRYWDSLPYESTDQTEAFLQGMIHQNPTESCDFIVEHKGHAIGKAGCWQLEEIGFILHPDHWGKGLAFEALSAVIPHVFSQLPIDRLIADVDPRNAASLGVLGKLGFVETGRAARTLLVGEDWCDSVYLELKKGAVKVRPI